MAALTRESFTQMVDHTILSPTATAAEVRTVCETAVGAGTATVCVNPLWVPLATEVVTGSPVRVCAVAGFPLGASSAQAVGGTIRIAMDEGATEIDTVIPLGHVLGGDLDATRRHLEVVRHASRGAVLKVIIESAVLTDDQITATCKLVAAAGAEFVKTSTGFHPAGGATAEAVKLMYKAVGRRIDVKASGGIRTLANAQSMVDAGASRLGMSATAEVLAEFG